jgi:hypothetical protein
MVKFQGSKLPSKIAIFSIPLLILLLVPSLFATVSFGATPTFGPAINLSHDSGLAQYPAVSNYQDHVYVVWSEGSGGILFRESSNGGSTWTPSTSSPALKLGPKGHAQFPVMFTQYQAVTPGTVLTAWAESAGGSGLQIYAAVSTNYGVSFTTKQVSTAGGITPTVAGSGSDLYVVWFQTSGCSDNSGGGCIVVSSSTNSGGSWSKPVELNPTTNGEPQAVASGSNAYVVADGIYFEASYNNGNSWSSPNQLFSVPYPNEGREPWIAASGNLVYTIWEANSTSPGVRYLDYGRTSTDGGVTWGAVQTIGEGPDTWEPQNVAFGSNVFETDRSLRGGGVYVSSATGVSSESPSWSAPLEVDSALSTSFASYGHLFTSDGVNVFLLWGQAAGSSSVTHAYITYSGNSGASWSSPINISGNTKGTAAGNYDITLFALSSYGTNCYAAWTYTVGSTSQIYFAAS